MGILDSMRGGRRTTSQEEVVELTNQFYVTLRASFAKVKQAGTPRNQEAFDRIEQLLDPDKGQNWTNAYEIEQLMVHLFDDDTVNTELGLRVLEARSVLRPELAAAYDAHVKGLETLQNLTLTPAAAAERRRTLLARLVNDLQWRYIVNEATRRYTKAITRRTAYLSVIALVLFLGIVGAIYYYTTYRNLAFTRDDLRLLFIAGFAGVWGATFSMLATLKSRIGGSNFDQLKLMRAMSVLLSRALVGAGAASILFFFLLSGLLGGSAFPVLGPTLDGSTTLPSKELAWLIVWCFIAGFSEQLVPDLLSTTEAKGKDTMTDRFQPTPGSAPVPMSGAPATAAIDAKAGEAGGGGSDQGSTPPKADS